MAERKVLAKYYPPDFDPQQVQRARRSARTAPGPKVQTVRLAAPFSMQCTTCGEYIYKGRRFNARKMTSPEETYLGVQIYRFFIRCTRCSAEICFRTDPQTRDYQCERGAKRNTEPWRTGTDESVKEHLDRLEQEQGEDDQGGGLTAMEQLEQSAAEATAQMAVADALDEIRTKTAISERSKATVAANKTDEEAKLDREDAEAARQAFAAKEVGKDDEVSDIADLVLEEGLFAPKKRVKLHRTLIARKGEASAQAARKLVDYESDSD